MTTTKEGIVIVAAATNVIGKIKSDEDYCYKYDGNNKFQRGDCAKFTEVTPSTIPGCDYEAKTEGHCVNE